ncbi:MAG: protein kinase [Planctomycetes bacterium]|nr:protein kinase [Planctomycetota bacterium]
MSERNDLLIGGIALERKLVTPEQLREALKEKPRPLGAVLVARGLLTHEQLAAIVDEALTRTHGDGKACPTCGSPFDVVASAGGTMYRCSKCGMQLALDTAPGPSPLTPGRPAAPDGPPRGPQPEGLLPGVKGKDRPAGAGAPQSGEAPRQGREIAGPDAVRETRVPDEGGKPFGKYLLLQQAGEGGFGAVYKAYEKGLGRTVALKFLHSENPEDLLRFVREAQTAAKLSHPNIVPLYEVGEFGGKHYIAMEFIEGQTLHRLRLEPRRALEIMRDVAEAIQYAHERGIVHRDLKPQNLMLGGDGRVRVMDFGLARQLQGGATLTASGSAVGTPAYMSPEQAQGKRCDERSDVYGLGATLYELVTGHRPFDGRDALVVLDKVRSQDPIPPRRLNPKLHPEVETIVAKAMEKTPARRYRTAKEFADDIRRHLDGEPILARPAPLLSRMAKRLRRHAVTSVAGTTVLVMLLGGLGILIAGRIGKTRAMSRLEREAEKAELDRAIVLWAQLESMGHPKARARIEEMRRGRAREQLAEARRQLALRDDAYKRAERHARDFDDLRHREKTPVVWTLDHRLPVWKAQFGYDEARLDAERCDALAEQAAQTALHYWDESDARRLLAEIYLRRWMDAEARRDRGRMGILGPLVTRYGGEEFRRRIEEPATLNLVAPGATAYLFRYEEHDFRLLPVPWKGPASDWPSPGPVPFEFRYEMIDGIPTRVPLDGGKADLLYCDASPEKKEAARRGTAYPLQCRDENKIAFPIQLQAGSYLVLLRWPGVADIRYPVWLERGEMHEARLDPQEAPDGFIYVPPGPAILGQDSEILDSLDRKRAVRRTHVDAFFIAKFETTFDEFREFLQDRGQDMKINSPVLPDYPVCKVTWNDAVAYAEWRTGKKGGGVWRFRLPTMEEWEKAARGADGRFHVWGDGHEALFYTSMTSRGDRAAIEPYGLFPADESPFGVCDMTGGRMEWTSTATMDGASRIVKGSAHGSLTDFARAAYCIIRPPEIRDSKIGFRLAADRIK